MFLFINSSSRHYSTCSCPIIINHSRAPGRLLLLTREKRCAVSCALAPPTVQVHKVELGEWDGDGSEGEAGRGEARVGGWSELLRLRPSCWKPSSFRSLHALTSTISLLQHIQKHTQAGKPPSPLRPTTALIRWEVNHVTRVDGCGTGRMQVFAQVSFVSVSLSAFISLQKSFAMKSSQL